MNKIDLNALTNFLDSLRANSYTAIAPDGSSKNRFDDTTVSFSTEDKFLCYTAVVEGVLYYFYSDLILYKDSGSEIAAANDPKDFELINAALRRDYAELERGLSFRSKI